MAGPETIHTIVEKIEVKGADRVRDSFDKVSGAVSGASGSLGGFASSMMGQVTVANLLTKAIDFAIGKIHDFVREGWEINRAYEAAGSRIQGMTLGLMDFGKLDPAKQIEVSQRAANATMREFRDIAMETATPIEAIENAYAGIAPVLAGLGKDQKDLLRFTKLSTSAAKVYGERAQMAGSIVSKAIFQGVVEGETAFARAFKSQAQVTSKMGLEERIKRITAVLEKMGGPVKTVTQDTAGALDRWRILSMDVLQRVTFPIYKKIGEVVAKIVDYFRENEAAIDKVVIQVEEFWHTVFEVGNAVWEVVSGFVSLYVQTSGVAEQFEYLARVGKVFLKIIDAVAFSFRVASEGVQVLIDPSRGMGKLNALAEAFKLKWLEIVGAINKAVSAFARVVIPDWLAQRVPGAKAFLDSLKETNQYLDNRIAKMGEKVRGLEKAAGFEPLTETTRQLQRAQETGLEVLKGRETKFTINQKIDKIEVNQDFRDQDPDRVMIEFVSDLERLSQAALQSTVGGAATAFGGGSTQ